MLSAILICPDTELKAQLIAAFDQVGHVGFTRSLSQYPPETDLVRLIRAHAPEVVFVGVDPWGPAREMILALGRTMPAIQVVALNRACDPNLLLELMRAGIREVLAPPFSPEALLSLAARLEENVAAHPVDYGGSELVYTFLPAKAGVGATTLAVNAAAATANIKGHNVLLADFDLNSGLVRFMLKLDGVHSVVDAAEHASNIDEKLWPQLVTSRGQLDVLHSGRLNPGQRIEPAQIRYLLQFARRNYSAIFVDLSGNMERYSVEIMHEARKIMLVCTAELPSLHLAREKIQYLRGLELGDRICLLLNRVHRRSLINAQQIEELLGVPAFMNFPNDYLGVHQALERGSPLEASTELGRQIAAFARSLTETKSGTKSAPPPERKRRFVEYFSVIPAKYA